MIDFGTILNDLMWFFIGGAAYYITYKKELDELRYSLKMAKEMSVNRLSTVMKTTEIPKKLAPTISDMALRQLVQFNPNYRGSNEYGGT